MITISKTDIVNRIVRSLEDDLEVAESAARFAYETATHEENKAENKFDTRGLEASYLAAGQNERIFSIKEQLQTYRDAHPRQYCDDDDIGLLALVETQDECGDTRYYFTGPTSGGKTITIENVEIIVVTEQSPIGETLLASNVDDDIELYDHGHTHRFIITALR